MTVQIKAFFDPSTYTYTYIVSDSLTRRAVVIDPVLDYDPAAGRISAASAQQVVEYVRSQNLAVEWIVETHIHADHLTASSYLQERLGGRTGIGERVTEVQALFGARFNAETDFCQNGSQFDALFKDGDQLGSDSTAFRVLATPGHTPACVTYVFDAGAFVGDTLFMPDYGTARADFPGGDARTLYESIQKILALPDETPLYMCHDYGSDTRIEYANLTNVGEQKRHNKLINQDVTREEFVEARERRDAQLNTPALLYPAIQFNMRGGRLPPPETNGQAYFKIPVRHS